jgi:hypothetical protein
MGMTPGRFTRIGLAVLVLGVVACGGGEVASDTTSRTTTAGDTTTTVADTSTTMATTTTSAVASTLADKPSVPTSVVKPEPGEPGAVVVTGTDIQLLESLPVQVRLLVSAEFPTPCHEAKWDVDDDGTTLNVTLGAASDPDVICTEVIQEVEFEIDLGPFPVGSSRDVVLNGELVGHFDV